jgi:membrane-bound lytic murein transglycosylase B
MSFRNTLTGLLLAALALPASAAETDPAAKAAFIAEAGAKYGLTDAEIEGWLAKATYQQSIVTAMSRPAERVRPWKDYRPIFITDARIAGGQRFLAQGAEQRVVLTEAGDDGNRQVVILYQAAQHVAPAPIQQV